MIFKSIRKKILQLSISPQLKEKAICFIDNLHMKQVQASIKLDKMGILIKISQKYIKLCQKLYNIRQINHGQILLQFIKSIIMQIHQCNRIEVCLIKIRIYLLTIKWSRIKQISYQQLILRVNRFLDSLKSSPLYQSICTDYYSHIERLYLEIIKEKINQNHLNQSLKLIGICFQIFKLQISAACNNFSVQDKKNHRLLENKLQLLNQLFKFEHGVKVLLTNVQPQIVTSQILSKYQRITSKIPIAHFPSEHLLLECQHLWNIRGSKTLQKSSFSRKIDKRSEFESAYNIEGGSIQQGLKQRQSLQESMEYLNQYFKKRSNSLNQFTPIKINLTSKNASFQTKKSNFSKDKNDYKSQKINKISLPNQKQLKEIINIQKQKSSSIGGNKQLKLVIQMDRKAKQKLITYNPFSKMKDQQLNILQRKQKNAFDNFVFFTKK